MGVTASVVICAHDTARWDDLVAAVASVAGQVRPALETVVVVDHNDVLLARARRELADVVVTASTGPTGLSGARNTGVATARGDVVAFLDDDARAEPGWLAHLLGPYDDEDVLGVGGHAVPAWDGPVPRWFPEEFLWVVGCSHRGLPVTVAPVRNLLGCTMSVRRDVLVATGGFDTGLGRTARGALGCEETDLCIRARAAFPTGRFLLEPRARVAHHVPESRATWAYFVTRCRAEGTSKAAVSRRLGPAAALETERAYVRRVLPGGVLRHTHDALRTRDLAGLARAVAIVSGLAWTTSGYLLHRGGRRRSRTGGESARVQHA